jgi:UDP-glucose 4-epimerase
MKILLTGGAGYVGSACLRWLLGHGHDPLAYDDLRDGHPQAVPDAPRRLIDGDISDTVRLTDVMREYRVEAVMHFAGLLSVPTSIKEPKEYYDVNVVGTKSVLDAMRNSGVRKILFSSTAATYGFHAEMPLHEASPQSPETPYGNTKLAAEWLIKDYARAYDLGYTLLRYFNAAGADPDGNFGEDHGEETHLIPLILQVAAGRRTKVFVYGNDYPTRDGTCVRDYVHTADLAQAHQLAIEALEPGMGRAYNVGSGTGATVFEVLRACEEVVGRPIAHEIADRRPGDPAVLVASPEKLVRELGWSPRCSDTRTIIRSAWEWHRRHPDGYGPAIRLNPSKPGPTSSHPETPRP